MNDIRDTEPAILYDQAIKLHQAGRLHEATSLYHHLLGIDPRHSGVHHMLGVIAGQQGRPVEAVAQIRLAIALNPNIPLYFQNLAIACEQTRDMAGAAAAWNDYGLKLQLEKNFTAAIEAARKALALDRHHFGAHCNLGAALHSLGRHEEAIAWLIDTVIKFPDLPDGHLNLGNALMAVGRLDDALKSYRRALDISPDYAEVHSNYGLCLSQLGDLKSSESALKSGLEIKPNHPGLHVNLGNTMMQQQRLGDSVAAHRAALRLKPDLPIAHWNLALALLASGQYREGWAEYEWRWKWSGFSEPHRGFRQPVWNGETPSQIGGSVLVTSEQGYGDTIQFCRYLPMLVAVGHKIIFEVQEPLHSLLAANFESANIAVIPRADTPLCVYCDPEFSAHVALMSLPHHFRTDLDTIPADIPYLKPDPDRVSVWQRRLGRRVKRPKPVLRVGLVWAGRPEHSRDRERSIPPELLQPLADVEGVSYYSLQKGTDERIQPEGLNCRVLGPDLEDFNDTAAVISCMDLIITVDTAVAHLAGSLGREVWVLLAHAPDWRWMLSRTNSPWYPTVRLFRQTEPRTWHPVIQKVQKCLQSVVRRA